MVVSAVFEGKEVVTVPASLKYVGGPTPATDPINNKVLSHSLTTWGFSILLFLFFWVVTMVYWCYGKILTFFYLYQDETVITKT